MAGVKRENSIIHARGLGDLRGPLTKTMLPYLIRKRIPFLGIQRQAGMIKVIHETRATPDGGIHQELRVIASQPGVRAIAEKLAKRLAQRTSIQTHFD